MATTMEKKRSMEELQRDSSGVEYSDERILQHLQQVNDLALELLSDVFNFRLVDQSNGLNEGSVNDCALTLREYMEHEVKIRSAVIRSTKIYAHLKNLYMSMQDVKTYLSQAMRLPATSSKDIFIAPFKTISTKMKTTFKALLGAVMADINSPIGPNSRVCAAKYQLGITHMYGLDGNTQNYSIAADLFQEAAVQGNTDAMVMLARCYLQGNGVDRDELKGYEWLAKAANSRMCPHAKDQLAMLIIKNLREIMPTCIKDYCANLLEGDASTVHSYRQPFHQSTSFRDYAEEEAKQEVLDSLYGVEDAIKLLLSAAAEGCVDAKSNLGFIYEEAGDLEQAATWYSQASEEGCARGTYLLGHLYMKGKLNASKTKTFNLLKQAARGGETDAFYALGTCYETGIGVEINLDLALQHYRTSAQGGSKIGMYSLGYLLVQNAIEMRKRIKQMRPYVATAHSRLLTGSSVVMEDNPDDRHLAELREDAEVTLQEGIHWLRSASENHIKDAAFQLGRLYEQAIGVPDDSFAALANYKWAAHLGHTRAAFYAANLLYAHANSRGIHSASEAARYYHQAALGGIVEAMNSYAILLEDGRASEMGLKDLHLAAAWFYQACIETEYLEKAYINLAMLLISTPLSSFRTIPGDIVSLANAKEFLLDFFESDAYTDNDRREVILQMIDEIDEHSTTALPLVEEVSLSLVSPRRNNRAAGRYDQHNLEPSSRPGASAKRGGAGKSHKDKVEVDVNDHEEVDVQRIPTLSVLRGNKAFTHSAYRTNRVVHEEVHKLSRGPIQNVGIGLNHAYNEEKALSPPRGMSPPHHLNTHRPGELYNTDGPVIPPSFVPRAVQYHAPGKSDKPAPRTKASMTFGEAAYGGLELNHPESLVDPHNPTAAPHVPVLSSPTRKQHAPTKPPRTTEATHTLAAPKQAEASALPPQPAQPRVKAASERLPNTNAANTAQNTAHNQHLSIDRQSPAEFHAKHSTRRLSFISGLVSMMGKKEGNANNNSTVHEDAPARTNTTAVSFQQQQAASAKDDSARRSMDSLHPPKKTSMWKSVKNATKTSSSVDYSHSQISAPLPDSANAPMPTFPAANSAKNASISQQVPDRGLPPPKPARTSFSSAARGVMGGSERARSESPAQRASFDDDSSRKSLDSQGLPRKPSMWKSLKNATTSKSVDYSSSTISAPLDAPTPASHQHLNPHVSAVGGSDPPKKTSHMSFSGIASGLSGSNRSHSASPAVDRTATFNNTQQDAYQAGQQAPVVSDKHREAMGVFASEPLPVPSPPKPPKPQFIMRNPNEMNQQGEFDSSQQQQQQQQESTGEPLGSSASVNSAGSGAYLNARTQSTRLPEPRQGGYPPLPGDSQHLASGDAAQQSQVQSVPQGASSPSMSAGNSRSSTPDKRKSSSMMARLLTSRHKKYLNQDSNAAPTATATLAASSTGTMDSLADASTPDRPPLSSVRDAAQQQHSELDHNFGYHSEEEEPEPSRISMSETFEPLSDLSLSSRDIRR